jgi:hypothetical protein
MYQSWLIGLQSLQVAVLLLHDWIPLGRLTDLPALRRVHSRRNLVLGTIISSLPVTAGLVLSLAFTPTWPQWLSFYLLAAYGLLFIGELEAWWIPYLVWPQPQRAAEYALVYGETWAFLPSHNGITPNTFHVFLHGITLATLLALACAVLKI